MLYSLRYASDFINPLFAMNECSNIKRLLCSVSRFNKDFKADICTYYPLGSICNLLPFGQFLSLLVALIPALVALTASSFMYSICKIPHLRFSVSMITAYKFTHCKLCVLFLPAISRHIFLCLWNIATSNAH